MPSIEAMRLFVKILEEDDPGWYSRASNDIPDPVVDVQINVSFGIPWDSMSKPWELLHISFA
jgi:hypothetical protein